MRPTSSYSCHHEVHSFFPAISFFLQAPTPVIRRTTSSCHFEAQKVLPPQVPQAPNPATLIYTSPYTCSYSCHLVSHKILLLSPTCSYCCHPTVHSLLNPVILSPIGSYPCHTKVHGLLNPVISPISSYAAYPKVHKDLASSVV